MSAEPNQLPLEFQNVTDIRHWGFDTKYALEEQCDFSGGLMLRLPHPLLEPCVMTFVGAALISHSWLVTVTRKQRKVVTAKENV